MRFTRSFLLVILTLLPLIGTLSQPNFGITQLSSRRFPMYGIHDVTVSGNRLLVTEDSCVVGIHNIADPSAPVERGIYNAYCYSSNLIVEGTTAYIPNSYNGYGIDIVNISNTMNPVRIARIPTFQNVFSIAKMGSYLCVIEATGSSRVLRVVYLANPTEPLVIALVTDYPDVTRIVISGNIAYLSSTSTLYAVSLANPTIPTLLGTIPLHTPNPICAVANSYAYSVGNDSLMCIYNVSNPSAMSLANIVSFNDRVQDVKIAGSMAYVSNNRQGIKLVDVTNPTAPVIVSTFDTPGHATRCAVSNSIAYVCDWVGGVRVVDCHTPTAPVELAQFASGGYISGMCFDGVNLYYTDTMFGLRVADVANPTNPHETSFLPMNDYNSAIARYGNYCYVASGDSGIAIVDVTTPASPRFVRYFARETQSWTSALAISDDKIFYTVGWHFYIASLTDPESPTVINSGVTFNYISRICVVDNYAYLLGNITGAISGVFVLDCTNPQTPTLVGQYTQGGLGAYYNDLAVSGDYAYLASYGLGLRIISVANRAHPQLVTHYEPAENISAVTLSGNHAFLGGSAFRILNIANPSSPQLVGFLDSVYVSNVCVNGSIVYSGESTHLRIYDCSGALSGVDDSENNFPTQYSLKPNYPNPFNSTTTISYTLPLLSNVELKLFDLTGREVASLVNQKQQTGSYRVTFDGMNLSSGTYFVKMQAGEFVKTQKLVLLR
ncbi:MAG: T9SS type A sorting domain-containing protein [bacterium]|nr:T9SS type A sorting domain-containing protein [bacterium]